MLIQGKEFKDGKIIISADYRTPERLGAAGTFFVTNIYIEYADGREDSVLSQISIDQETHYQDGRQVIIDLELNPDDVNHEVVIDMGVEFW